MRTFSALGAFLLVLVLVLAGCTHQPLILREARPSCANFDWYEMGRTDGVSGGSIQKIEQHWADHRGRCEGTPAPESRDLYVNGFNEGIVEYCSAPSGFAAGRSGAPYSGSCPAHLQQAFLDNYEVGKKIRELEIENAELDARIDDLTALLVPGETSTAVREQIDKLRARRSEVESEIFTLESQATSSSGI